MNELAVEIRDLSRASVCAFSNQRQANSTRLPSQWFAAVCTWVVFAVFVVMAGPQPVCAQATASFFNQVGAASDRSAAEACASSFSSALTGEGLIERPSAEVETLMRECVEDLSNPDFARQCDLRAAVGQVDYIIVYNVGRESEEWYFHVEALSPLQQGTVWQQGTLVAESSAVRGAMTGCGQLAQDFLIRQSFVDDGDGRTSGRSDELPAVVEVVSVTPSPVAVYVDGDEVGIAPGQFDLPPGQRVEFELRSPGFVPWSQAMELGAGELMTLPPVALTPLPGTIEVLANVQGAELLVGGSLAGTTVRNRPVPIEVPSGLHELEVRRDGYVTFRVPVRVTPGGVASVTADLLPVAGPIATPVAVSSPSTPQAGRIVAAQPAEIARRPNCTARRVSGLLLTGVSVGLLGYGAYLNGAARITQSPGQPWEDEGLITERRVAGTTMLVSGVGLGSVSVWQAARRCR